MKALKWFLGILAVFVVVAVLTTPSDPEPATPEQWEAARAKTAEMEAAQEAQREIEAQPKLELLAWSWSQGHNYATVEGMVKNVSGEPMRGIQVMAIFDDAEGGFITSGSSYIEYQPVLPGQSSPFKVMQRWNPAMKTARIEFKAGGRQLPYTNSAK